MGKDSDTSPYQPEWENHFCSTSSLFHRYHSRKGLQANSPRRVGPSRAGDFGLCASVASTAVAAYRGPHSQRQCNKVRAVDIGKPMSRPPQRSPSQPDRWRIVWVTTIMAPRVTRSGVTAKYLSNSCLGPLPSRRQHGLRSSAAPARAAGAHQSRPPLWLTAYCFRPAISVREQGTWLDADSCCTAGASVSSVNAPPKKSWKAASSQ